MLIPAQPPRHDSTPVACITTTFPSATNSSSHTVFPAFIIQKRSGTPLLVDAVHTESAAHLTRRLGLALAVAARPVAAHKEVFEQDLNGHTDTFPA